MKRKFQGGHIGFKRGQMPPLPNETLCILKCGIYTDYDRGVNGS